MTIQKMDFPCAVQKQQLQLIVIICKFQSSLDRMIKRATNPNNDISLHLKTDIT